MITDGISLRRHREELGLSQAKLSKLAAVSQHVLSAFELGKIDLSSVELTKVSLALSNDEALRTVVTRKKRYQQHEYYKVEHDPARARHCEKTAGNTEYVQLLSNLDKRRSIVGGPSVFSLFSGCGGFSLGFTWAGYSVKGFVELEPAFRRIYCANFPNATEFGGDITKISPKDLETIAVSVGEIDVLIGGPPCQGFSLSGKREVSDPRNTLFRHYLRFVNALSPKIAIIENVRLLTSMKSPSGSYVRDEIKNEFSRLGYRVQHFEVNACDYGVPQHRERVLFVAVKESLGMAPAIPTQSFGSSQSLFTRSKNRRSFADACSDLAYLESGEKDDRDSMHHAVEHPSHVIKWLWDVPQGFSAHDNSDKSKRPPSGYNTTYKRQIWNEPGSTVQTTFGMISGCRNVHPIATRSLTIREAARLQSFPDTFKFPGTLGAVRTSLGNAVPPLLAYTLAEYFKENFLR